MVELDIQHATSSPIPFSDEKLVCWVEAALKEITDPSELTLRLVDADEIQSLNATYRNKNKPTNVLAFPANLPEDVSKTCPLLGDIIVCPWVLEQESQNDAIPLEAHWAHIVIHGVLHLLGYDHIEVQDEQVMQAREIEILATLGFANPYLYKEESD